MTRCIVCGKKLAVVNRTHLRIHGLSMRQYNQRLRALPETAWLLYWTTPVLQSSFSDPLKDLRTPVKGFKNFKEWLASRHPEIKLER